MYYVYLIKSIDKNYEAYHDKSDARKREIELKILGQKKEILFGQIKNSLK